MDQLDHVQVPHATNNIRGESQIRITHAKANKKGFTVALACHGNRGKLSALIIFKEATGQLGPRVKKNLVIPANIQVQASMNDWMTTQLYLWWLKNIYGPDELNQQQLQRLLVLLEVLWFTVL